ncbi:hypothetical protein M426DRAFT_18904 [Hypoxylon sp. CI-4A]|nr:hypothetical protein M426DRAFT_18904 [Hypoxylon sp. CI-4A]
MDRTTTNTTTSGRTKAPKKRNSDIRKEQNRIASRAYREKRKQKLALLDEILKTDSQTDSMSSASDETEAHSASWSRQASDSPVPAALVPTQWSTASPSMSSAVPSYGHNTYDGWMNPFEQQNNAFPTSNDYMNPFISPEVGSNSLEVSSSYSVQPISSITSAPLTPPVPPILLDPLLGGGHYTPQHTYATHHQNIADSPDPVYGDDEIQRQLWVASLEDNTLAALEKFAGFSHVQQQQILAVIQKRKNIPSHQGLELRYPAYQSTPPPSARFINTDYRKYQNMRHASGSPVPHGHR